MDTAWPPQFERIKNPTRFSLLSAPISRSYTESVPADISDVTYTPYVRNNLTMFPTVAPYIKCAKDWQESCRVPAMLYEYHFWINQYLDPGGLKFARVIYDDIQNYKKHGLNGLINDCSQRSFWPNGFSFFVYGQAQFDTSLSFEALLEDYFSHAYGEDWKEVVALLERIGACIDNKYLNGEKTANKAISRFYNPAMAEPLRKMKKVAEDFTAFAEAHRTMPYRAQTVAHKLLRYHVAYCAELAECLVLKCFGIGKEAKERFFALRDEFGKTEHEIGTYCDHFLLAQALEQKVFKSKEKNYFDV
jgi:hypothetical protein